MLLQTPAFLQAATSCKLTPCMHSPCTTPHAAAAPHPPVQRPVCCEASRVLAAVAVAKHDLLVVVVHAAQVCAVPAVVEEARHDLTAGVQVIQRLKQRHHAQAVGVVRHLARLRSNLEQKAAAADALVERVHEQAAPERCTSSGWCRHHAALHDQPRAA